MAATADDIYCIFGRENVRCWADLNNDSIDAEIDAVIAKNLELALCLCEAMLSCKFVWADIVSDKLICYLCAMKAGLLIYTPRAVVEQSNKDFVGFGARYEKMFKQLIDKLLCGELCLSSATDEPIAFEDGLPFIADVCHTPRCCPTKKHRYHHLDCCDPYEYFG